MKLFLKAKHWQIFVLLFGLPLIIEIFAMPFMVIGKNPMVIMKIIPAIAVFCMAGLFGWLWSIAVSLQQTLPDDLKIKTNKIKVFLIFPVIYFLVFFVFINVLIGHTFEDAIGPFPAVIGLIFPIHLFAMFCIVYSLYFTAKVYKTAELQRKVTFADFAGEFFLIWFFPIGVWIIQPKINRMIEQNQ